MNNKEAVYAFGPFHLDIGGRRLTRRNELVQLEPLIFNALVLLIQKQGELVTKQEFVKELWPGTNYVDERRLHQVIQTLRKKLGDNVRPRQYIETVSKHGYRFIAELQQLPYEKPEVAVEEIRTLDNVTTVRKDTPSSKTNNHKNVRVVGLLCLSGLLITFALVWFKRTRTHPAETLTTQSITQLTTRSSLTLFPTISPDGGRVAYSSDHNGNFEIYIKQLTPGGLETQITTDGQQNFQPAWSPDGQHIVYHSKSRGGIWEIPTMGGKARQLTNFGSRPAWSPDGTLIAFQSNPLNDLAIAARNALPPSTLWIIPSLGGETKQITQTGVPIGGHGCPSWSPDGKRIVFEADQYDEASVWSISVNGGDLKRISPGRGYDPIYAPNGKTIYFTLAGLWGVDVAPESGEPISSPTPIARATSAEIRYPSISFDGKKVAYSALSQNSNILSLQLSSNATRARESRLTDEANTRNTFPVFSPDGRKIAYDSGRTGAGFDIWIMNADGSNRTQLTTHPSPSHIDHLASWFPTMDEVAFMSIRDKQRKILVISTANGQERVLLDLGSDLDYFRLSPDGKYITFTKKQDGVVNIWTMPVTGGEAKQLTFDREMAGFPAWSPDGKWIAFDLKRGDDSHIAVVPSDGGTPMQLTFDRGQSWLHDWAPDADKIVFAGFRNHYWNIWWVSLRTKEQKQLTDYKKLNAYVRYPAWSPLGNQIAYEYTETTGNIWVMQFK